MNKEDRCMDDQLGAAPAAVEAQTDVTDHLHATEETAVESAVQAEHVPAVVQAASEAPFEEEMLSPVEDTAASQAALPTVVEDGVGEVPAEATAAEAEAPVSEVLSEDIVEAPVDEATAEDTVAAMSASESPEQTVAEETVAEAPSEEAIAEAPVEETVAEVPVEEQLLSDEVAEGEQEAVAETPVAEVAAEDELQAQEESSEQEPEAAAV
jgi:hypothetical protein